MIPPIVSATNFQGQYASLCLYLDRGFGRVISDPISILISLSLIARVRRVPKEETSSSRHQT
jgi:hypothetical protein